MSKLEKYKQKIYPYVTTQASNNGIADYFGIYTDEGNVLVVDSAVAGYMTYQDKNFSASDHVEKLIPKFKLNKFVGLFIASIWNKKYAFNTYTTQSNALPNEKEYYKFYYTEGMVTPETPDDGSMPQVENGKSAKGHKFKETDKNVGFATKTLLFNKKLTADLRSQTNFDFVVGGSYGPANKEYLAWYLDDVELIY